MSHVRKEKDSVTIRPETDIVASTANEIRGELKTLIDEGRTHVIVDLESVEMVESDDGILRSFVEESRDHLADIENDLRVIDAGGMNGRGQRVNQ